MKYSFPVCTLMFCLAVNAGTFLPVSKIYSHAITGPHVIIYKTKGKYDKLVPVTLSKDKRAVVSYPDPKDIYYNGKLAYPTKLADGFWLDNRGLSPNSAFIKLTYEQYSQLQQSPSTDDLMKMIVNNDPFKEMYDLGERSKYKDLVNDINSLIRHHELGKATRLK